MCAFSLVYVAGAEYTEIHDVHLLPLHKLVFDLLQGGVQDDFGLFDACSRCGGSGSDKLMFLHFWVSFIWFSGCFFGLFLCQKLLYFS